jgi:hypothetical protein
LDLKSEDRELAVQVERDELWVSLGNAEVKRE